eukprot:CAMPEP_0183714264 /NCGR_PEP_ID=MMETSP0737-20130205/8846_1 /TAXON_ID=385413 /ORGANISM="Thalassiosira miniscula, Strain CCMP1093" /LENGTH=576 /DNA_ID=CAMNT_0025943171 /DNA_START=196 /DNA_END=1926 /DNA_ORIENTATION=+
MAIHTNRTTAGSVAGLACGTVAWLVYRSWARKKACPNVTTSDNPVKQGFSLKKVPPKLDAIVIGSGIGGLATAAILSKAGKRVLVLEQHDIAGGNLHTFTEKGYEFDTGLHYIGGDIGVKGSPFRKILNYITDEEIEWERMDDAYDVAISGDDKFHFYTSWTRLKKELKASFPDESMAIDKNFEMVHRTAEYLFPVFVALKMLPESVFKFYMWLFHRQFEIFEKTTKQVLETITSNKKLMGVLSYHFGDYGEVPERGAFVMHALVTNFYRTGAYYPIGGPLKISESIVRLIEKWGGKVLVRAPVSSILIDDKSRACGVIVNGKQILAKYIVSSVGAPATMTRLVPESHRNLFSREIDMMKDQNIASNISLMSMFVGIDDSDGSLNLPKCNYWIHHSWDHDKNMAEHNKDCFQMPAYFISFSSAKDPTYASRHPGKQVALVIGPSCYDDVEQFKNDRVKHRSEEYLEMKDKWQQKFTDVLLGQFPELRNKIKFVDMGTAVTNDFYLGTHRGAVYGLAHTPKRFAQHWLRPKTNIKNLFLSGQDACVCGIGGALVGGYMCAYRMMSPLSSLCTLLLWV